MRPLLAVVGSAFAALAVFRCLYIYDNLYPLADGAVIGVFIYGCVKASEWLGNPRIPAWALVPADGYHGNGVLRLDGCPHGLTPTGRLRAREANRMNELSDVCCDRQPVPAEQRKMILQLLRSGEEINASDKNGVTALHHAVSFRSPTAVKTLLEHGANVNQACRRNGSPPLHRAVTQTGAPGTFGRNQAAAEIVKLLLAAGADPTIANKAGKMPADYVRDHAMLALLESSV